MINLYCNILYLPLFPKTHNAFHAFFAYSVLSAWNVLSRIWLHPMFQNSAQTLPPLLISTQRQSSLF